jgi:hypothetical protein
MQGTAHELVNSEEARKYYLGERFYMDTTPDARKKQV